MSNIVTVPDSRCFLNGLTKSAIFLAEKLFKTEKVKVWFCPLVKTKRSGTFSYIGTVLLMLGIGVMTGVSVLLLGSGSLLGNGSMLCTGVVSVESGNTAGRSSVLVSVLVDVLSFEVSVGVLVSLLVDVLSFEVSLGVVVSVLVVSLGVVVSVVVVVLASVPVVLDDKVSEELAEEFEESVGVVVLGSVVEGSGNWARRSPQRKRRSRSLGAFMLGLKGNF